MGAAVAILFAAQNYDSVKFCGQGDVGDPGMTVQDWSDAVDYGNPAANVAARTKAQQWFQHIIFPVLCLCSDGTAPPTPVVTSPPPTGGPSGVPNSQIGGHCFENKNTKPTGTPNGSLDWNDLLPQIPPLPPAGSFGRQPLQTPLPASATFTVSPDASGANPMSMFMILNFFTASGTLIAGSGFDIKNVQPGTTQSQNATVPSNAASWNLLTGTDAGASLVSTNSVSVEVTIYCQGQSPTGVSSPCCPPDPAVQGQLGAIYQMLTELLSLQALQGPYQDTIRHAGLSGNGTISINPASSAIRVEVRSDLTNWPHNVQTPPYFYSLGFVTPFAVGTPLKGQRLVYDHQTFTWPSYTDTIGYSLAAGVTVDLVELTRGA